MNSSAAAPDQVAVRPGAKLKFRNKLSLAGADYGVNLAWHSMELFLLFYYTDVAGLPPLFAGFILTMGSLWDAMADIVIGSLADRTRTRWGRFRPWVVGSGPAIGIGLALTFYKPGLEGAELAAYALITHLLFRTAYSSAVIPYVGLTARVTHDPDDRATISAMRMQFAGLASLTVAFAYPQIRSLLASYGEAAGFVVAAAVLGALITPVFLIAMRGVQEPPELEEPPAPRSIREAAREDFSAFGLLIRNNGPFVRVLLGTMLVSTAGTLVYKTALYYYKYYAAAPDLGKYALAMSATAQLLLAPVWAWLANRTSKRSGWFAAAGVGMIGLGGLSLIPPGHPMGALGLFFLFGAANVGLSVMFWSMIPDTIEVNEHKFGERYEGKTVGLAVFARKITLAFNALLVGSVLELANFTPNAKPNASTLDALRLLIGYIPVTCLILTIVVLWRYRLDRTEHARLRAEIAARRSGDQGGPWIPSTAE